MRKVFIATLTLVLIGQVTASLEAAMKDPRIVAMAKAGREGAEIARQKEEEIKKAIQAREEQRIAKTKPVKVNSTKNEAIEKARAIAAKRGYLDELDLNEESDS